MSPCPWQPPPPPFRPNTTTTQGLAIASMVVAIFGLLAGGCLGPIPGIIALVLGLTALSQIKKSPETVGGKPFAVAGVIIGAINIALFTLLIVWWVLALAFG